MSYNGADLIFPHLGIVITSMKNHITVFGYNIAFYGMIIGIGIILGMMLIEKDARRRNQDPDLYYEYTIYAIIFGVIGSRLYYVAFQWEYYKGDILKIINIHEGGVAIYGAIIGGFLTAVIFCFFKKFSLMKLTDTVVLGLLVGQIFGRWGNFFNCEAFGGFTDSLFAMRIRESLVSADMISEELIQNRIVDNGIVYVQVHPTFLYESVWNLLSLIFLYFFAARRQKWTGEITVLYFLLYGFGRFFIEGMRTDSLMIPNTKIAVSQALSGVLFVLMLIILVIKNAVYKKKSSTFPN